MNELKEVKSNVICEKCNTPISEDKLNCYQVAFGYHINGVFHPKNTTLYHRKCYNEISEYRVLDLTFSEICEKIPDPKLKKRVAKLSSSQKKHFLLSLEDALMREFENIWNTYIECALD